MEVQKRGQKWEMEGKGLRETERCPEREREGRARHSKQERS
jgi:hypothetical protein